MTGSRNHTERSYPFLNDTHDTNVTTPAANSTRILSQTLDTHTATTPPQPEAKERFAGLTHVGSAKQNY
ncbi:hypothetical protein HA402_008807 [Bradysia odoriphaga]|nr:hypothetical protein HA402_008807 [Bradysia odoriphaga]